MWRSHSDFNMEAMWLKCLVLLLCRAPGDHPVRKELLDQEESRWVIFSPCQTLLDTVSPLSCVCVRQRTDRYGRKKALKLSLSLSFSIKSLVLSLLILFYVTGQASEPGPSGKAGLPGTPVSYLFLMCMMFKLIFPPVKLFPYYKVPKVQMNNSNTCK